MDSAEIMMSAADVKLELKKLSHPDKKVVYQRFFKTGPGQYGEGDVFIGCTMPEQRTIAKKYVSLSFPQIQKLLDSKIHEHRMTGLIILTYQFADAEKIKEKNKSKRKKKEIYDFYMENLSTVNNWDLVDVTVPNIVGKYLYENKKEKKILDTLYKSNDLWERRVAVLATFTFIRNDDFKDILRITEQLLDDQHDLMHKACGWMLREVGKRDERILCAFLDDHTTKMPRTMLRYAIERFPETKRKYYLNKK